ncbi:MAG: class I SAM-dependent methyltransferase [Pseudomonadota bacterium]
MFSRNGEFYRQVNSSYADIFDQFVQSGLYDKLVSKSYLVAHEELGVGEIEPPEADCHKILKPAQLAHISYPYEWSFSQLKDAALLTLRIQALALRNGFSLKDASAYNIQFVGSKPIFIDTLSFEPYVDGKPWSAYRQYCQHFLAPLALIAYRGPEFSKTLTTFIDGVPLEFASRMLPLRTKFSYGLIAHIHAHARIQGDYADSAADGKVQKAQDAKLSKESLLALIESLARITDKLQWKIPQTEWGDYYANTNYSDVAANEKEALVDRFLADIPGPLEIVQDLGANTGKFSRIASARAATVVAQDIDPVAVERHYLAIKSNGPENITPLIQDLFAPSPAIGWANTERDSFVARSKADVVMALALIHHLAISNNAPLENIARLFASLSKWLIIEFVPKSDSQVVRLLQTREDIFPHYNVDGLEKAFSDFYSIKKKEQIAGADRILYLMERR